MRKSTTPQEHKQRFYAALANQQLRSSPVVRMELYNGARNAEEIRQVDERLKVWELPLAPAIADIAADAVAALVSPGFIKLGDALIAATARAHRIAVLTCDWSDFPQLAENLRFDLYHPLDEARVLRRDPRHSMEAGDS